MNYRFRQRCDQALAIFRRENASAARLASALGMHRDSTTSLVESMLRHGLIIKHQKQPTFPGWQWIYRLAAGDANATRLGPDELRLLDALFDSDTVACLADVLRRNPRTVQQMIDRLVQSGYVRIKVKACRGAQAKYENSTTRPAQRRDEQPTTSAIAHTPER